MVLKRLRTNRIPNVVAPESEAKSVALAPNASGLGFTPRFISQDSWAKRFGAWGSLFVTAVIFALLTVGLVLSARTSDPTLAFSNLMETIKNLAMVAAGFWLGSSNSGQKKDDTISEATAALAVSAPVVPVVKP